MQIVIDIPENLYKATLNGLDANEIWDLRLAVKNGIPLDNLRAEIEELDGKYVIGDYATYGEHSPKYVQLMEVLRIINKYREGSDTE